MTKGRSGMLNGVDPEDRMNIIDTVSQFTEILSKGGELPPLRTMADIFLDRSDDQDGELTYEQHIQALSNLFISTVVMLAERNIEEHKDRALEVHVLITPPSGHQDHVTISVSGYNDVRCAIAALANLERDGYIDQLWNLYVKGKVDPNGPQVVVHDHLLKEREETA
jgi:hypothetical protein